MSHHLLVVDDEADLRTLVSEAMQRDGHLVKPAAHGMEALRLAVRSRPSLVITDLHMPVMDGLQLIENLRRRPALAAIPVILWTALPSEEPRVATASRLSGVHVVMKGPLEHLRHAVTIVLHRRSGHRIDSAQPLR
ncbi:MAG TPA: response regulator [Candidatus Binatia bacterium]|nr:response regulator [Candidatus Binatia bacterium]